MDELAVHRPAVRGFLLRLVRDEALADDLTQETYARACSTAAALDGRSSPRSWLCAIALNLARDQFRAGVRRSRADAEGAGTDAAVPTRDQERSLLEAEMSSCVLEILLRLPSPQRDVVALHDMAGLRHAEIAATLDISVANSRVLLHRGRAALKGLLERHCVLSFGADAVPCERRPADPGKAGRKTDS